MNLFDSHCHLENEGFQNDLPEVMQRMAQAGVRLRRSGRKRPGNEPPHRGACQRTRRRVWCGGVHPHEAKTWTDETEAELKAC